MSNVGSAGSFREVVLSLTDQSQNVGAALTWRIRWVAVRGLASVIAGVVVLGVGGRLVMLASRLIHPDAIGRLTENGNRIGEFTVDGTIELILFGGLGSGVTAGVVWVLVKEWIPKHPVPVGLGAVAIGGFLLVEADNTDFAILGDPRADLVLLLGLIFVFGVVVFWLDRWLDRRLPEVAGTASIVVYSLLVAVGVPFLIPVFGSFFSSEWCFCANPPIWTGIFLAMTSFATIWWWILNLRGWNSPPQTLRTIGTTSIALTVTAGSIHLAREVLAIL